MDAPPLTKEQFEILGQLPEDHVVVGARRGAPIIRRDDDGQLLLLQPNGRLSTTTLVERVRSYLEVAE